MDGDSVVREGVVRRCVAVAATVTNLEHRGRWIHQLPGQDARCVAAWASIVGRSPHLVIPGNDAAPVVETAAKIHCHRRALRLPGKLVRTHPLHTDRTAYRLGEHRRVGRDVVETTVAVAPGAFAEDRMHLLGRQTE